MVRNKVAAGEYQSESDVVRDGLHALQSGDLALEDWLKGEVVPAFDAMRADPSRALSVGQVRAALAALHREPAWALPRPPLDVMPQGEQETLGSRLRDLRLAGV